jgi:hypothetical protein
MSLAHGALFTPGAETGIAACPLKLAKPGYP